MADPGVTSGPYDTLVVSGSDTGGHNDAQRNAGRAGGRVGVDARAGSAADGGGGGLAAPAGGPGVLRSSGVTSW